MTTAAPGVVTELLRAWSDGDEGALERLVPLVEAELRRLARGPCARARGYQKRGGGAQRITLDEALLVSPEPALDLVALDRALVALAAADIRKSRVIELRFFGGLSVEETADVLHVSADTIKRDWRLAKLWLLRELDGDAR